MSFLPAYNIEQILETLKKGGLILFPSDTIWCIGCDATSESAVKRVLELKEWDYSMPLNMMVSSMSMLKTYVKDLHPRIETLLAYHYKPLTIIFDKVGQIAEASKGKDGSAAFRIVQDELCLRMLNTFGKPIVATSAHIGHQPFPRHFGEISSTVIMGVDHIVKHRQMDRDMAPPSVIARLDENEELIFLRE
jgi:L-threonylcarbamoyladenylate synthase